MNAFKTKKGVGKKILSVASAAMVGLSGFGGLEMTQTSASAAAGVYYDAGTLKVDDKYHVTGIDTALADPGTATLEDALSDGITLDIADKTVTFSSDVEYSYVAKGEQNNGKINWTIKAWPSERKSIGSNVTKTEAASGWNTWYEEAAPRWTKESWIGDGSADTPWITLKTIPFNENNKVGRVDIDWNKRDATGTTSANSSWYGDEAPEGLMGFINSKRYSPLYSGVGIKNNDTSEKTFGSLIKTTTDGNGHRTSNIPSFAIPMMIREAWFNALYNVIADSEKTSGQSLTGIRLETMNAKITYDETTAPTEEWGGAAADLHVYELEGVDLSKHTNKDKLWKTLTNFGVNDDSVTHFNLTGKKKQKITYSEATPKMIANYSSDVCKVSIDGHEVSNTRISVTTKVNATWSYSADRPRLTGTVGSTAGSTAGSEAPTGTVSNKSVAADFTNNTHTMTYSSNGAIKNTVQYTGLTTGKEYTVTSTVYDLATGKQALSPVSMQFTADDKGYVEVQIPSVNSIINSGKTFSVAASISDDSGVVCSYSDMTDTEAHIMFPSISAVLTANDNTSKSVNASNNTEVVDTISYTGLTPGCSYKITGYLIHQEQSSDLLNAPVTDGSEGVITGAKVLATQTVDLVPTASDGSVKVTFNANTAELSGQHLSAVVSIADASANAVVGEHKDISGENRVVEVTKSTGNNNNNTAVTVAIVASACAVIAVGLCIFLVIKNKRAK